MHLNQKIAFILTISSILFFAALWFFVIRPGISISHQIEADYRNFLKNELFSYLQQIDNVLNSADKSQLDPIIAEIKNNQKVLSISVFDANGIILATTLKNIKGKQISSTTFAIAKAKMREPVIQYSEDQNNNTLLFIYSFSRPDKKTCAGGIEAFINTTNLNHLKNIHDTAIPLYFLISFVLLIGLNYVVIRIQVTNKLKRLHSQLAIMVEQKIIESSLPVEGTDEIADFTNTANHFIANLEQIIRQTSSATDYSKTKNKLIKESSHILNEKIKEQGIMTDQIITWLQGLSQSLQAAGENTAELGGSTENTSAYIFQMQAAIQEIVESIGKLSSFMETNSDGLNRVTSLINTVGTNIDELSSAITEIVASTSEMDYAIKQVDTSTKDAARLSINTMKSAETGSEYVLQTIDSISSIKNSVEETSRSIDQLIDKTVAISKVLTVIKEITERTNLLSLNASILAAQAGEYGRSFGVVATEIKHLADKTASSTKEIKGLINQIQLFSQNTRHAMDASVESINTGIHISSKAGNSLKDILQNITNVVSIVQGISNATTEQSRGSKQITDAMEKVAEMTQNISNSTTEVSRVSQDIAVSTNEVKHLSSRMITIAGEQEKGSKEVLQNIEKIASLVNAINESGRKQVENIIKVNMQVASILELTKLFMINSQTINKTSSELDTEQSRLMQQVDGYIRHK